MKRPDTQQYSELFLNNIPLMDTRAPIEFAKGAFPNAISIPLMNDEERAAVGTCYKKQGQEAAIQLGHKLVSGATLEARLQAWSDFASKHPQGYLYCFRGGLRSQLVQQTLADRGIHYPRVTGGYKAMRTFLLGQLTLLSQQTDFWVIAGRTGVGKTRVITHFANSIDLEKLANHKGSSFGGALTPQPSQIDFENALAIELLNKTSRFKLPLLLEDEGYLVGRCAIPVELQKRLQVAPVVLVHSSVEDRAATIADEYICKPLNEHCNIYGTQTGWQKFRSTTLANLDRIKRRLGGQRHRQMTETFELALNHYQQHRDIEIFFPWISYLLEEYYDPMYDYQLRKNKRPVLLKGSAEEVCQALTDAAFKKDKFFLTFAAESYILPPNPGK